MTVDLTTERRWIQEYYGKVLGGSKDLKTNACCASGAPPARIAKALANVHADVVSRFYGCGFPIPEAVEGATILDLGCGTGRDVYVLAQLVGPSGRVIGLDMTDEQLAVARATEAWHQERFGYARSNVEFHQGFIEDLSFLPDQSVDIVVSNCVVNLSPHKDRVMREVFRVLKPGGEFYLSDVFCDRRLPVETATDPVLYAECLGGAMYDHDFEVLAKRTGFLDPRSLSRSAITISNPEIEEKVGAARFTSVTVRLFKLAELDTRCEDYGQVATLTRRMTGFGTTMVLDEHHTFELGRPERVCGNTAAMLASTRFAAWFRVDGDTTTHYGVFDCSATMATKQYATTSAPAANCC